MDYSELKVPNHVAIILDGNGRWANKRGFIRTIGHERGVKTLKNIWKIERYLILWRNTGSKGMSGKLLSR